MQTILLTGGCGFIGSHCAVELIKNGYNVIIVDNLNNSSMNVLNVIRNITAISSIFYQYDITNYELLNSVFINHHIDAVIHLAGYKSVGESVANPLKYYDNNVGGLINLLKCMENHKVNKIIFSSSATVYGQPKKLPIDENSTIQILNPYGQTKYMSELILKDTKNISIILRYFNPVGGYPLLGEQPRSTPTNLFPVIMSIYNGQKSDLDIFGSDYNTNDGTAVRDYIHVVDLAKAHVKALDCNQSDIFNLGTGKGYSVLDIVKMFEKETNKPLPLCFKNRRLGDAEMIYADCSKAKALLNWQPEYDLQQMVKDTLLASKR
jgi:UDP-glucose 4-epimerase